MKIIDIALKDLLRSFRSLFAIGMMFAAPLLITGLIYFAFGGLSTGTGRYDLPPVRVVLVNLDQPAQASIQLGQMLADFFKDEEMPAWLQVSEMSAEASARAAVDRQEASLAIIIPSDFSNALTSSDRSATLILIQDPTLSIGPQIVQDILAQFVDGVSGTRIALTVAQEGLVARGLQLSPAAIGAIAQKYSAWFTNLSKNLHHSDRPVLAIQSPFTAQETETQENPLQKMIALIMSGQLIFFCFYTGAVTAQSILQEDEEGTLPRLFTTPTARSTILGGKFTAVFITALIQVVVMIAISGVLFRIRWGQPASMALLTLGLVTASSGLGIFLMSLIKTTRQSGPVLGGLLTATGMLGGLFTTNIAMPPTFNQINLLFPQGWALRGWKLLLGGAGPAEVLLPTVVMLIAGAALFAIGVTLFRRRYG